MMSKSSNPGKQDHPLEFGLRRTCNPPPAVDLKTIFFCGVDDFILDDLYHRTKGQSASTASALRASDSVRLFGPRESGETPILAPKKSTEWDTLVDFLGYTVDTHTMPIAIPKKVETIKRTLDTE